MREKIKNLLLSYWGTVILCVLTALAIVFYSYAGVYIRHRILFPVFVFLAVACMIPAYKLFSFLWRTKWRDKVFAAAKKFYSKYGIRLFKALEKLGFGQSATDLGGRSSISFNFGREREDKRKVRAPKWKNLRNEKQRLGFLYRAVIMKKIKHGSKIYASETPAVINARESSAGAEAEVMDLYCRMRYSTLSPDGERIDELKREIEA